MSYNQDTNETYGLNWHLLQPLGHRQVAELWVYKLWAMVLTLCIFVKCDNVPYILLFSNDLIARSLACMGVGTTTEREISLLVCHPWSDKHQ